MKLFSTYSVKIKHYTHIFKETVLLYRAVVDFLIGVCLEQWDIIATINQGLLRQQYVEHLCHKTKSNLNVKIDSGGRLWLFTLLVTVMAITAVLTKKFSQNRKK